MGLGQKGVFWFADTLSPAQLVELAQRTNPAPRATSPRPGPRLGVGPPTVHTC
jgi:hypothetical protein